MNIKPALLPDEDHGKNWTKGRSGERVRAIVVHVSEGTLESMTSWFNNLVSDVSSHYAVARDGRVLQYVRDEDTAWHAGKKVNPTAPLVLEIGGNPNDYTIGIEHEGHSTVPPTEAQLYASAELIAYLSVKHGVPLDDKHIIPHHAIRADKTCPGLIRPADLITRAQVMLKPKAVPGDRRWSNFFQKYVILTEYTDDRNWKFVTADNERTGNTAWSELPFKAPSE